MTLQELPSSHERFKLRRRPSQSLWSARTFSWVDRRSLYPPIFQFCTLLMSPPQVLSGGPPFLRHEFPLVFAFSGRSEAPLYLTSVSRDGERPELSLKFSNCKPFFIFETWSGLFFADARVNVPGRISSSSRSPRLCSGPSTRLP